MVENIKKTGYCQSRRDRASYSAGLQATWNFNRGFALRSGSGSEIRASGR